MSLTLIFSDQAMDDVAYHKKSGNKALLKKLLALLEDTEHPFTGTGKPEALKHNLTGKWSRRINQEHRLIYKVSDKEVEIISLKGHY